jgi:hypothetical protein
MKHLTKTQCKLIEQHLRIARELATKVTSRLTYGERYSAAYWGLIVASTKWKKIGTFEAYARKYIYGAIIRDSMLANYSRTGGKRKGISSRICVNNWDWFNDYNHKLNCIDDADEMSYWRKKLANKMYLLTPTETEAIKMRLVGDKLCGVHKNTNQTRLAKAIQRLKA